MSFLNKYTKGQYEYAAYNKKKQLGYTIALYALSALIYLMGLITTGSNKNLLTIVAVLGILPASKMLISAIMACRVKSCSLDLKEELDSASNGLHGMYHVYFTSYDINYYLVHCVITTDSMIGYTDDKNFDFKKFEEHLDKHMKIDGISNILIKAFDNKDAYINRLGQLSKLDDSSKTNTKMIELVNNISV